MGNWWKSIFELLRLSAVQPTAIQCRAGITYTAVASFATRNVCPENLARSIRFFTPVIEERHKGLNSLLVEIGSIDAPTIKELKKIIQEHGEKIYARYSNVVGLKISNVRCVGGIKKDEPCIVLYCLDKTLLPFGENPLPDSLGGWPCDIREDIVMLGQCLSNCTNQSLPELGCSIGSSTTGGSGSVGFYYKSQITSDRFKCGFLTASHVALDFFEDFYNKSLLSRYFDLRQMTFSICHPSREDCRSGKKIGKVVESFLGNVSSGSSEQSGLDIAVVESNVFAEKGVLYFVFISKLIWPTVFNCHADQHYMYNIEIIIINQIINRLE